MSKTELEIKRVVIIAEGGRAIGRTAAFEQVMSKMQNVVLGASFQDIMNKQSNTVFANESLKLKCFDTSPLIELTNKKGPPFEEPKSKYINRPIKNYRR